MCQQCVDDFEELWPELSNDDRREFLWTCTAFPVGNNTRERLVLLIDRCGKDFAAVLAENDREFWESVELKGGG